MVYLEGDIEDNFRSVAILTPMLCSLCHQGVIGIHGPGQGKLWRQGLCLFEDGSSSFDSGLPLSVNQTLQFYPFFGSKVAPGR